MLCVCCFYVATSGVFKGDTGLCPPLAIQKKNDPLTQIQSLATTFPCIVILLRILCCIPVTTASGEHIFFSAVKYIKSYLRSTMTEDRLNGLFHMYINIICT